MSDVLAEVEFLTVEVVLAAQVLLDVNGVTLEHDTESFYALTMGVAEGRIDKRAVAAELERIAKSKSIT